MSTRASENQPDSKCCRSKTVDVCFLAFVLIALVFIVFVGLKAFPKLALVVYWIAIALFVAKVLYVFADAYIWLRSVIKEKIYEKEMKRRQETSIISLILFEILMISLVMISSFCVDHTSALCSPFYAFLIATGLTLASYCHFSAVITLVYCVYYRKKRLRVAKRREQRAAKRNHSSS